MKNTVLTIITTMLMAFLMLPTQKAYAEETEGTDTTYAKNSVLLNGSWAKISVSTTGIHKLTSEVIKKAGFSDLSKVKIYGYGGNLIPDKLTQSYLKEHDDLKQVPTCTVNGVKYFYAEGPVSWSSNNAEKRTRNYFSDYGYYFITENDDTALTCTEQSLYDKVTNSTFSHHFLYENDKYAWAQIGRNLVDNTKITSSNPQTVNVVIPKGNTEAEVQIAITAGSDSKYQIVYSSGQEAGQINNQVKLADTYYKCNVNTEIIDLFRVDTYTTDDDGNYVCPITISATNSSSVLRLDYVSAYFDTPAKPDSLSAGTYPAAKYVYNILNQNHHADEPQDLIIIIPTNQNLLTQAEALAEHHAAHDNITSLIVPADELYNEFSSGTPDFSAYKRYLKMFYDRSKTLGTKMPKNVLLFGDAVWDNRMITIPSYNPDSYLLCHETENSYSTLPSYTSDDFITVLDDGKTIQEVNYASGTGPACIGIGRIPVTNSDDAKIVVDKIKNYDSTVGSWQNDIFFFADDGDNNSHMANIDSVASKVVIPYCPGYYVKKAYADAYVLESTSTGDRYPDLAALIKKQQNKGTLVINYGGHANGTQLSDEMLVTLSDCKSYKGENYSLWFTAGCETVPFDQTAECIGEQLLLNKNGGAIAFYGTSRTVEEAKNAIINRSFMRYALSYDSDGNPRTLGEAQRLAKNAIITQNNIDGQDNSYNKHQYHLIGDPAMSLAIPRYKAVIDQINDKATTEIDTIEGNSVVTLKGHIADFKDATVTTFNGKADILVRDSERKFSCRDNRKTGNVMNYWDRTNILYRGTSNVTEGQFTCTFKVPSDIYDDKSTGLITVFATDSTNLKTAHGECGSFRAMGWIESENDSIGPSIFAYLNSPSFQSGDAVSQTPFFVAEVNDNDGLSTTGMALGHNMELVIDGSASMTYDLNDNFTYDSGSYTSGQTYYTIPSLTVGAHKLTFTAWDILGNPSRTSLAFNVVKGVKPQLTHISVSPNPITDEATFYVTHDMKGSEATINIDIIDLMGRVVQTLTWTDTFSESNSTTKYKWNPSGLSRGIYLYRVRISCNGSDDATQSQKLIIAQ